MQIKLRDYQADCVRNTAKALTKHRKVLVQLETGGGKSIIIAYIANNIKGRTLILTHRIDILKQNSEWLSNHGVLTSKENTVSLSNDVVIASVATLHARIKKHGINYIGSFDCIICDEVHILIFEKVYKQYDTKFLIGFTATPSVNKRELVKIDGIEYWKEHSMSDYWDVLVTGPTTKQLIIKGYLVEEQAYKLELPNMGELEDSNTNPDGYTSASLTKVYSNKASMNILWEAYKDYAYGKKTLIFNATTKVNPLVQELFTSKGVECRLFDSVNSASKERNSVIEWFKDGRNKVLIGTGVFTTGFNIPDIEVIILNRATKSLNLYIQMAGRGSRTTSNIFKNKFILMDLGQNIDRHGMWSDDRNWQDYFHPKELQLRKKKDITVIWECAKCGAYNPIGDLKCCICGAPKPKPTLIKRPDKTGKIVEVTKTVFPRSNRIIEYTKVQGKGSSFAFKILENKLLDLFKQHDIQRSHYINRREDFLSRIKNLYIPIYFGIIKSDLKGKHAKLQTKLDNMYLKIDNYFNYEN